MIKYVYDEPRAFEQALSIDNFLFISAVKKKYFPQSSDLNVSENILANESFECVQNNNNFDVRYKVKKIFRMIKSRF